MTAARTFCPTPVTADILAYTQRGQAARAVRMTALVTVLGMLAMLLLLPLTGIGSVAHAQGVQNAPKLLSPVTDMTGTLSRSEQEQLRAKLLAFEKDKGVQIAVLVVDSTSPEDIFSYTNRIANTYKLGRKDIGDGILLVVAKSDRRMRIAVAKTLEGAVPDVMTKRVINTHITPAFKRGDFFAGLNAGTEALIKLVKHESLPDPQAQPQKANAGVGGQAEDRADLMSLLFFGIVFLPAATGVIRSLLGRVPTAAVMGTGVGALVAWALPSLGIFAGLLAGVCVFIWVLVMSFGRGGTSSSSNAPWIVTSGGGNSDFGSDNWGGSGGDSWSSGGGGDFGGGGASGDW